LPLSKLRCSDALALRRSPSGIVQVRKMSLLVSSADV
jgi:hypothetical protein